MDEKLYARCAEAYYRRMAPSMDEEGFTVSIGALVGLDAWRDAVDMAYEAGLVDGAKMLAAEIKEKYGAAKACGLCDNCIEDLPPCLETGATW